MEILYCMQFAQRPLSFWRILISASWGCNPLWIMPLPALWLFWWYYHIRSWYIPSIHGLRHPQILSSCYFFLNIFRRNRCDDFFLNCMLIILAGDELESLVLPVILDTLPCRLWCPYWVGCIIPCIDRFLVGSQTYFCVECGQNVIPNNSIALSSNWHYWCHISPDIFISHLGVSVGILTVYSF